VNVFSGWAIRGQEAWEQLCTFNDDIQGTAAVATGTLLSAINVTGIPMKDQRIAVLGFGGAGMGISQLILSALQDAGLSKQEAYARFYCLGRYGLLVEDDQRVRPEQRPFARKRSDVTGWQVSNPQEIGLLDVIRNAKPTVLIGVSGQPGAFPEEAIRAMAKNIERPIIFPLSNPTSRCEATPQQIVGWTEGKALIGTGSPFGLAQFKGKEVPFAQTNNSYIFPGLALGILSSHARHVSDAMIKASALALAELSPTRKDKQGGSCHRYPASAPSARRWPEPWDSRRFGKGWRKSMNLVLRKNSLPIFGNLSTRHTNSRNFRKALTDFSNMVILVREPTDLGPLDDTARRSVAPELRPRDQ
jgi:malic enzyme